MSLKIVLAALACLLIAGCVQQTERPATASPIPTTIATPSPTTIVRPVASATPTPVPTQATSATPTPTPAPTVAPCGGANQTCCYGGQCASNYICRLVDGSATCVTPSPGPYGSGGGGGGSGY
ncbi:MAG TPA: hypothetical protein VGQ00_01865 [Candidatus Norongarragalinales archaeon]|nr:hypothetical protein [Candidatus Norongarragalinales archaeon]